MWTGEKISKVLYIVALHSKYSRALTFENVVLCLESALHLGASAVSFQVWWRARAGTYYATAGLFLSHSHSLSADRENARAHERACARALSLLRAFSAAFLLARSLNCSFALARSLSLFFSLYPPLPPVSLLSLSPPLHAYSKH